MAETVHEEMLRRAAVLIDQMALTSEVVSWIEDYRVYVMAGAPVDGMEYVWAPETDPRWEVLEFPSEAYVCRGQRGCKTPPVIRLNRAVSSSAIPRWFYYCETHSYGRRIVDGTLEARRLVQKGTVA